jgi:serine/threonine protein kinase
MNGMIGQTFGPYKITERIGEGGMAVVYKGYQQSLNRYVAIKVLRSELAQDKEFVTRFRREALAVAELSHPNILHVYDAGYANGVYYIVMAYVDGGSLKELVLQGPVDMDYAISIAAQVADALHHAHQRSLIHRDVKPNNILMSRDGRPLLTDFGIAKALHDSSGLTRTGTSIGTPEYMAPEQIQGQKVDGRTDIYALGIVLYEMLVGWVPFSAHTPVAALYKQVNEPPPPLRQANINVPDWLDAVVLKALAKSPSERFQQASDFAEALRQREAPRRVTTPRPTTPRGLEKQPAEEAGGAAADPDRWHRGFASGPGDRWSALAWGRWRWGRDGDAHGCNQGYHACCAVRVGRVDRLAACPGDPCRR